MIHRFGIVGAGMIAPYHLEALRELPNAEPAGIMDHGTGQGRRIPPDLDPTGASDLEAGREPAIDGRESRKAVSIIEAVYRSARRGGAPVTPP